LEESEVFESLKSLSSLAKTPLDYRKRKQLRRAAKKYSKAIVSPHEGLQYLRAMEALKFIRMELESSTWLYDVSFGAETIEDIYGKTVKPPDVIGKTSHLKPMYTQDLATVIPTVVMNDKEALEDELNAREELEAAKDGLTEVANQPFSIYLRRLSIVFVDILSYLYLAFVVVVVTRLVDYSRCFKYKSGV